MSIRVGVNGFGRIGRVFFRAALGASDMEIVGVNDLADAKTLAHLLKHDSVHGALAGRGGGQGRGDLRRTAARSGCARSRTRRRCRGASSAWTSWWSPRASSATRPTPSKHLQAGAKKVIITAPAKDPDITVVLGVNEQTYDPAKHELVSNASCTTNCLATVAKVLLDKFGIKRGFASTVHSYTNDQPIHDFPHKDLRRARAGAVSMIPTTTGRGHRGRPGAARAQGQARRHRHPRAHRQRVGGRPHRRAGEAGDGRRRSTTRSARRPRARSRASSTPPTRSWCRCDFNGNPHSSIVDLPSTAVVDGNLVKVLAWYDNEWGYSCRVRDLIRYMAKSL